MRRCKVTMLCRWLNAELCKKVTAVATAAAAVAATSTAATTRAEHTLRRGCEGDA